MLKNNSDELLFNTNNNCLENLYEKIINKQSYSKYDLNSKLKFDSIIFKIENIKLKIKNFKYLENRIKLEDEKFIDQLNT